MRSKKLPPIAPTIYDLLSDYKEYCKEIKKEESPEIWHKFLKTCGLQHTSMTRIEIINQKKWFLAKIKYGF